MDLANSLYNYDRSIATNENTVAASEIKETIIKKITEDSMTSLYEQLCNKYSWEQDEDLLKSMK